MDDVTEIEVLDTNNIAKSLSKDTLKKIGQTCVDDFNADVASRTDYDDRRATWRKLFAGFRPPKDHPFPGCANVHVPLMGVACLQFQARAYEALIQKEIVKCYTRDGAQKEAAERASKYMNWDLRYNMKGWEEGMDKLLLTTAIDGVCFKKTYRDHVKRKNVSMPLSADEFVINYGARTLEDADRKTHILWMKINDIKQRQQQDIFLTPEGDDLAPDYYGDDAHMPGTRDQNKQTEGVEEPQTQYTNRKKILEQHRYLDINYDPLTKKIKPSDGILRPFVVTVNYKSNDIYRIVSREYYNDESNQFEEWEYFTDFPFIPNPDSIYGFGFGQLIEHLNEAANTALNELLDSGHLSNEQGGLIMKRAGGPRGDVEIEQGLFKEIDLMGVDDIRKAVYQWQFKEPSQTLFQLLGLLHDYANEITTKAEWMNGQMPPSDTAATTMLAVIEQGLKVFSVIQKRIHRSLQKELSKIKTLNYQYLDERLYFVVQDSTSSEMQTFESGRKDFSSNIEIIPVSDPNITSRAEKLIKSQQVLAEVKANPLTMNEPMALYFATKDYLEALEATNLEGILKKPVPPPPPPDLPPEEENSMFLKEQGTEPQPQQNHSGHLESHYAFQNSMWGEQLTPHGKKLLEGHIMQHMSMLYLQEQQQQQQMQAQIQQQMMAPPAGGVLGTV